MYMKKIIDFFEKFFSVKNECNNYDNGDKIKIFTVFGIGIRIKINPKLTKNEIKMLKKYCAVKKLKTINKEQVLSKIENMKGSGILSEEKQRTPRLTVSLTSYPERMYDIHYCIYSLLSQSCKPDKIILWLSEEQFPGKEEDIPVKVKALKEFGLTIKWCKDLKSYKKLIPVLKEYPEDIIVTADDDIYYETGWLEKLYKNYDGKNILCHRAREIAFNGTGIASYMQWKYKSEEGEGTDDASFFNFFTGCGGVLYPPDILHKDVLNDALFMTLSKTSDDLWFWAMAVLNNTKVKIVKNNISSMTYINAERELNMNDEQTLYQYNSAGGNDGQVASVLKYYPEILIKLHSEKEGSI